MAWQDIIIGFAIVALGYALVPQVYKGFKDKRKMMHIQTTTITTIGMYTLAITYLTLDLIFSSIVTFITGTLWLLLFIQTIIYK